MIGSPQPYTFDRVVRMTLTAGAAVGLFLLVRYLSDVLLPFAAAVILAYLLNPLVGIFQRRVKRRGLAVACTLASVIVGGFVLALVIVPLVYGQVSRFERSLGQLQGDLGGSGPAAASNPATDAAAKPPGSGPKGLGFAELFSAWEEYRRTADHVSQPARFRHLQERVAGTVAGHLLEEVIAYMKSDEFRNETVPALVAPLYAGGVTVVNFAMRVVLGILAAFLVFVYLFFLLLDYPKIAKKWDGFVPPDYRAAAIGFLTEFEAALRRYFRGQSIVAACTSALFAIGFTLIGLPLAIPFGLFIGLLNMVPYLQSVSILPAMVLALMRSVETSGSIWASVAWVLLVYACVQATQDLVITPRIMGKVTGLRPVAILLGVFIWGRLLGFLGLILAIPLTCIFIVYYRRFVLKQVSTHPAVPPGGDAP